MPRRAGAGAGPDKAGLGPGGGPDLGSKRKILKAGKERSEAVQGRLPSGVGGGSCRRRGGG